MGMDKLGADAELNKCKDYVGSCCGNSFVIVDCRDAELSKQSKSDFASKNIDKYGVDSALFIEKSRAMDVFMEIFEKDGSESESCGNGTILIAYLLGLDDGRIEMRDNAAMVMGNSEKQAILMSIKFSSVEEIDNEKNRIFVKMGEPHIICLVDDLDKFDLIKAGEELQKGYPDGVNVDVIQKMSEFCYLIKTYERGVFALTKSCGTGSLSAYLAISQFNGKIYEEPIEFRSAGGTHWVSRDKNMLKLETLKKFCKIKSI